MKFIIFLFSILFFSSCSKIKVIYYEYGNSTITRVDCGNKVFLYFGKYQDGIFPKNNIIAEYSGFDSSIQGYLTFLPNGKVEGRKIMELFEIVGKSKNLILVEENNSILNPWLDTIHLQYKNTIEISNNLEMEMQRNKIYKSDLKAIYL